MSAETIQTFATLATLIVVAIGVTFGLIELRQEAAARRLQGMSTLFADVWPREAQQAAFVLRSVEPDFEDDDLTPEQRQAVIVLGAHYNRVGFLLYTGVVRDREILGYPPFGIIAADVWAIFEGFLGRTVLFPATKIGVSFRGQFFYWEYLAIQARAYWERRGRETVTSTPIYAGAPGELLSDAAAADALRSTP